MECAVQQPPKKTSQLAGQDNDNNSIVAHKSFSILNVDCSMHDFCLFF
jgi:hypothetical protein